MFALIELVPKKVYAAALAAAIALCVALGLANLAQTVEIAHGQTTLAQERGSRQAEHAAAARAALEATQKVAQLQAQHATTQQETVHEFNRKALEDRAVAAADRADADLLRDIVRTYAGGGGGAEGDAAACRDLRDRAQRLGGLVEQAVDLSVESEGFIRQRDREVKLLKGIVSNDRTLTP